MIRVPLSITALLIPLFLTACADVLTEHQGIAVDIVPTTHHYSIEVTKGVSSATEEVEEFIDDNWHTLADAPLELIVHSQQGQQIANSVKEFLRRQGKDPLLVNESNQEADGDFDFSLVSHHYDVVTPVCDYYQLGHFGETQMGCFSDGVRWQSIVYPARASR